MTYGTIVNNLKILGSSSTCLNSKYIIEKIQSDTSGYFILTAIQFADRIFAVSTEPVINGRAQFLSEVKEIILQVTSQVINQETIITFLLKKEEQVTSVSFVVSDVSQSNTCQLTSTVDYQTSSGEVIAFTYVVTYSVSLAPFQDTYETSYTITPQSSTIQINDSETYQINSVLGVDASVVLEKEDYDNVLSYFINDADEYVLYQIEQGTICEFCG